MRKHFIIAGKSIGFFVFWGLSISIIAIPAVNQPSFLNGNPAFLRLWWELIPLCGILFATAIFIWVIEKNKITVPILKNTIKNIVWGLLLGCVWFGSVMVFLYLIGVLTFSEKTNVSYLSIWFIAALLNAVTQEYLVRGYLFSLFKEKYNTAVAVTITTILFTVMHGGAFESGVIAVLNVATMSIFVSLLLIYTESLLAPIIAHFIWNGIGRLVFGIISMADDYPNLWKGSLSGNNLIAGGSFQLEGSIAVSVINLLLIAFMVYIMKRRSK